jgi:hypothetical protein
LPYAALSIAHPPHCVGMAPAPIRWVRRVNRRQGAGALPYVAPSIAYSAVGMGPRAHTHKAKQQPWSRRARMRDHDRSGGPSCPPRNRRSRSSPGDKHNRCAPKQAAIFIARGGHGGHVFQLNAHRSRKEAPDRTRQGLPVMLSAAKHPEHRSPGKRCGTLLLPQVARDPSLRSG